MFHRIVVVALLSFYASSGSIYAAVGVSTDPFDYIGVIEGDMPLLLVVEDGGWFTLPDPFFQTTTGPTHDAGLWEIYTLTRRAIYETSGSTPYVVYNKVRRDMVNTGRAIADPEAYNVGNVLARDIYYQFHDELDATIADLEAKFGDNLGVMVLKHGTSLRYDNTFAPRQYAIGSGASMSLSRLADFGSISASPTSDRNTMGYLYSRRGEIAFRGAESLPYLFYHAKSDNGTPAGDWAAISDPVDLRNNNIWPTLICRDAQDNWISPAPGENSLRYHGGHNRDDWRDARWIHAIDAMQLEWNNEFGGFEGNDAIAGSPLPNNNTIDRPFAEESIADFAASMIEFLETNYDWEAQIKENELMNGGFDDDFAGWGRVVPDYITVANDPVMDVRVARIEVNQDGNFLYQDILTENRVRARLSLWCKMIDVPGQMIIRLQYLDRDSSAIENYETVIQGDTHWKKVELTHEQLSSNDAIAIRVMIFIPAQEAAGDALFDQFRLEYLDSAPKETSVRRFHQYK